MKECVEVRLNARVVYDNLMKPAQDSLYLFATQLENCVGNGSTACKQCPNDWLCDAMYDYQQTYQKRRKAGA